ncbi:hypothetical protein B7486_76265, partial [cyanobacterium TDX16]
TWARHPWMDEDGRRAAYTERVWGQGKVYSQLAPSLGATPSGRRFLARYERQGASPRTARRMVELMTQVDVTDVLPAISVPTLVLHRHEELYPIENAHDLVAGIPDARLVDLPGADHAIFSGDVQQVVDAVQAFVVGTPEPQAETAERFLASVLSVDIVGSTDAVVRLGDQAWTELLDRFHALA